MRQLLPILLLSLIYPTLGSAEEFFAEWGDQIVSITHDKQWVVYTTEIEDVYLPADQISRIVFDKENRHAVLSFYASDTSIRINLGRTDAERKFRSLLAWFK